MATRSKLLSAEEFFWLPDDGTCQELVRGEVRTSPPPGQGHGEIAYRITLVFGSFIERHELGRGYGAETGFWIESNPDTIRAPDFAFVSTERLPPGPSSPRWAEGLVPDLVVEVASPSNSSRDIQTKMEQWLQAGVRLGLVAYPDRRSIALHRPSLPVQMLGPADVLSGGDVLSGFSCPVRDLFPR